jgi:urease gamma subunit
LIAAPFILFGGFMSTENFTVETLRDNHPEIVAQIEAQARQGMVTKADVDAAVVSAKQDMVAKADHERAVTAAATKATSEATFAERDRIMAIHASCRGSHADKMFENLVLDGCTERQANARIQDALAMASDALDIQSHHGGQGYARKQFPNSSDIYSAREGHK